MAKFFGETLPSHLDETKPIWRVFTAVSAKPKSRAAFTGAAIGAGGFALLPRLS